MYTIHPILDGTFDLPKTGMTYLVDEGITMRTPVVTFLLVPTDPADPVVFVDAGAEDGHIAGREMADGGPEPLRAGLADQGLTPDDVDYLVLTHLHHDHAGNVDLFADATVLLQRAELEAARDPLPYMRRSYVDAHLETTVAADLSLVDGGYRLVDGIDLRLTPGHTQGMQTVFVDTPGGPYALAGDLIYCRQNLDPGVESLRDVAGTTYEVTPVDWGYIPPGLHVDVSACYESIARVRERVADTAILGGHLPASLEHDQYPPSDGP